MPPLDPDRDESLTDEQMKEIDRRLAEFAANSESAVPWKVVEREALARIRSRRFESRG